MVFLVMLEFSAHEYVEISQQVALALASASKKEPIGTDVSKALKKLIEETNRLSLFVTREALGQFLLEIVNKNPGLASLSGQGEDRILTVKSPFLEDSRWSYHIECVLATLKAELKSIAFRVIPAGKTIYCDPNWLAGSAIFNEFPNAWKEFQSDVSCYALGENTAFALHTQRTVAGGLHILAVHLGRSFVRGSCENHL